MRNQGKIYLTVLPPPLELFSGRPCMTFFFDWACHLWEPLGTQSLYQSPDLTDICSLYYYCTIGDNQEISLKYHGPGPLDVTFVDNLL